MRSINVSCSNFALPDLYVSHGNGVEFFSPMKAGGKFGLKPRRIEHWGLSDSALEASFCVYVVERSSSFCHSQWLNDKGYFNFLLVMLNNSDHC